MFSNAWGLGAQVLFPTASHMSFPVFEESGSPQYCGLAGNFVLQPQRVTTARVAVVSRPGWSLRGAASAGHPGLRSGSGTHGAWARKRPFRARPASIKKWEPGRPGVYWELNTTHWYLVALARLKTSCALTGMALERERSPVRR